MFRAIRKKTVLLALVSVFSLVARQAACAEPTVTEAQAKKIAAAYCQHLGVPAPQRIVANLKPKEVPLRKHETPPTDPAQEKWDVEMTDTAQWISIDVDPVTGNVISYFRHNALTPPGQTASDLGPALPRAAIAQVEAEAKRKATAALQSAGAMRTGELHFQGIYRDVVSGALLLSWRREFHGLSYRDQGARVMYASETGQVIACSIRFTTPAITSEPTAIRQAKAVEIATDVQNKAGLSAKQPAKIERAIVVPNDFWQRNASGKYRPDFTTIMRRNGKASVARVAYLCSFRSERGFDQIWIDAENGKVLGGEWLVRARDARSPR